MALRIGIDTGGTFTDLVGYDDVARGFVYAKQPSTPHDPSAALTAVLADALANDHELTSAVLGTTVATNAVLQRRGARICFVTTAGFEDVPFIQRLDKAELYNLHWRKPAPLVTRRDCIGIAERVDHTGQVVTPLDDASLDELCAWIARRCSGDEPVAVAVCFLFAYLAPEHEQRVKSALQQMFPDLSVSVSHEVAPTWREYERSSTTIGDAYVKPVIRAYVSGVRRTMERLYLDAPVSMLKSNGGHLRLEAADTQPAQFLLSGLAGGIVAARHYSRRAGLANCFSLDMGGTSADIGAIQDSRERYVSEFEVTWGVPIAVPCVDVTTLGAGGGSIAWLDKGGLLQVGPRSAGAEPGPMCYGRGGTEPTVTDANLALGRLNPHYFLGGRVPLKLQVAQAALAELGCALGASSADAIAVASHAIIDVANENMANQIKLISVDRGLDPRAFGLMAFGGAGPVHAVAVARLLGIEAVYIPPHPGLCSAFGALAADWRVDRVWTVFGRSTQLDVEAIAQRLALLTKEAVHELREDGFEHEPLVLRSVDVRYAGQNYEREVALPDGPFTPEMAEEIVRRFARAHDEFYGFSLEGEPVEFVNVRVTAIGPSDLSVMAGPSKAHAAPKPLSHRGVSFRDTGIVDCPIYRRADLPAEFTTTGPVIVEEPDSTTVVEPGDTVRVRADGLLQLQLRPTHEEAI